MKPDSHAGWKSALIVLAIALLVRAPTFGQPLLHMDENFYLLVGDRWLHANMWPYADIWDRKPVGLFLIFGAIRMLGGDGFLAYQLVASQFVAATAWVVMRIAALLAPRCPSFLAAVFYVAWINLFGGYGGQAPVFFNLLVAGSALITVKTFYAGSSEAEPPGQILWAGSAAMLLIGTAIQIKPTVVFEGILFGCLFLWHIRRQGLARILRWGGIWVSLAVFPSILAALAYALKGNFDAFFFANFTSILRRTSSFTPESAHRLIVLLALASPLCLLSLPALRRPMSSGLAFAFAWAGVSLLAVLGFGTYYLHYGLPLVAPLSVIAAIGLGRLNMNRAMAAGLGIALILASSLHLISKTSQRGSREDMDVVLGLLADHTGNCPYFTGPTAPSLYLLSGACLPTRYVISGHLFEAHEARAIGVDQETELRRIVSRRPRLITLEQKLGTEESRAMRNSFQTQIAKDYRLIASPRLGRSTLLVFAPKKPDQ